MNEMPASNGPIHPPLIPRVPLLAAFAALALFAGATNANAATYSAPGPISIPGFSNANPYPAAIDVTGLTGTITDVNVRLNNLTHGTIDDVAVAVQAPNGQSIMLMSGVGRFQVTDATLAIDDEAAQQFQNETNPVSGSYRPAQYYTSDTFPAPGPGQGYCNPGPVAGGSCTLSSAFDGSTPIGTWRLWVVDHLGTSSGQIAGGWSVELTTNGPADFDPPQTTIDSGPTGTIDTTTANFQFSASEQAAFDCKLDSGSFVPCSSPVIYTALTDGEHTFAVRSTDPAGNVDTSPASRSFTVDTSGPDPDGDPDPDTNPDTGPDPDLGGPVDRVAPRIAVGGASVKRAKRTATVTFTAIDDTTPAANLITTCSLDEAAPTPCTSPLILGRLKPGKHAVEIRATDAAGNASDAAAVTFKVRKPKR